MSDDDVGGSPEELARWERLARYLAGECSADEADAVRRQLLEDPAQAELFRALADHPRPVVAPTTVDVEGALRRVRARLADADRRPIANSRTAWRVPALAAAAVILVASGLLLTMRARRHGRAEMDVASARSYAAPVGARDSIRLPDGSRVLLGPGSALNLSAGYGTTARDVAVTGEAYFDVRHDAAHPFTVRAGAAVIRDVGTTFSVHDDATGEVRVVVTQGAVLLRPASRSDSGVVLHGGDAGVVTTDGRTIARIGGATPDDLAWTSGRLVFREASFDEVAAELHRWYGIELVAADPALADRHLTATFSGDPAPQVVQVIALAIGAQATWHGDTVVMRR